MIGRTSLAMSAMIVALLVGATTYAAVGSSSAHTAVGRVALDDLVVRWPHHDAALETGVARVRSDDAFAIAVESTDDGILEYLRTELPENQTIFDVVVKASDDANAIAAADAVSDWLVTDSLERRRDPNEARVAELEAVVATQQQREREVAASLDAANGESERIIGRAELGTATSELMKTEKALAELNADLALIKSQFLVVGHATSDESSNARVVTALAAALSAGFLTIALAEYLRARRERNVAATDDG